MQINVVALRPTLRTKKDPSVITTFQPDTLQMDSTVYKTAKTPKRTTATTRATHSPTGTLATKAASPNLEKNLSLSSSF